MATNGFTLKLTEEQQKIIKDATSQNVTELRFAPPAGELSEEALDQVTGGFLKINMTNVMVTNVSLGGHGS